ncbi:MAG: hypothetical protein IJX47_00585 [Clostridia bacterium]|nr:hypothetical protein [Clostridia bacterium]
MFGLFGKKAMDIEASKAFWNWFVQKEEWIKETVNTDGMRVVGAVDAQLKPVFSYFKGEIEFQLGYNDGTGEFFFFHLGDPNLLRDGKTLGDMMPDELREHWTFILEA